jgi:hypothetical protein
MPPRTLILRPTFGASDRRLANRNAYLEVGSGTGTGAGASGTGTGETTGGATVADLGTGNVGADGMTTWLGSLCANTELAQGTLSVRAAANATALRAAPKKNLVMKIVPRNVAGCSD